MSIIKPFFIAVLILASLFTAGIMNSHTMEQLSDSIDLQLQLSQSAAQEGDWDAANQALAQASETWLDHDAYLHVMIDHNEIDAAESIFAEVREYADQQDSDKYRTSVERLSEQLDHIKETQQLSLKNIL